MSDCCHVDYRKVFRTKQGHRDLKTYERRGLFGTERESADLVRGLGIPDPSLIEVGAGLGVLHVELLSTGAGTATAVDISAGWNEAAGLLLKRRALEDRVTRIVGDFVDEAEAIAPADVVMLHRVICCYEDWVRLVDTAAGHAQRAVVFTVPPETLASRVMLWLFNTWLAAQRCGFRSYVHPIGQILDRFGTHGFEVTATRAHPAWVTYRLERQAPDPDDVDHGSTRST